MCTNDAGDCQLSADYDLVTMLSHILIYPTTKKSRGLLCYFLHCQCSWPLGTAGQIEVKHFRMVTWKTGRNASPTPALLLRCGDDSGIFPPVRVEVALPVLGPEVDALGLTGDHGFCHAKQGDSQFFWRLCSALFIFPFPPKQSVILTQVWNQHQYWYNSRDCTKFSVTWQWDARRMKSKGS